MASLVVLKKGIARTVYDDRWLPIIAALGIAEVARATEIEYDHARAEWQAVHIETGVLIGADSNRGQVIEHEVSWLEERLIKSITGEEKKHESYSNGKNRAQK